MYMHKNMHKMLGLPTVKTKYPVCQRASSSTLCITSKLKTLKYLQNKLKIQTFKNLDYIRFILMGNYA